MSNFSCPARDREFNITNGIAYEMSRSIERIHYTTPRFGHTNNLTAVLAGDPGAARDYLVGLVSASIAMFAFFAVWLATILLLKCCGYRVGFLSGRRVLVARKPEPPTGVEVVAAQHTPTGSEEEHEGLAEEQPPLAINAETPLKDTAADEVLDEEYREKLAAWERDVRIKQRRMRRIRITVLVSGTVIVVAAILMVVMGMGSLSGSVGTGLGALSHLQSLCESAAGIIEDFMVSQNATNVAVKSLKLDLNTICPPLREELCANATTGQDCNFDGLPSGDDISNFFSINQGDIYKNLVDLQKDLLEIADFAEMINAKASNLNWAFWLAAAFVILLAICTLLIMNGVIQAWRRKLGNNCWSKFTSCTRHWFVLPVFVVLLILSWIFSMIFVIGSTSTADMCYQNPNENVLLILDQLNLDSRAEAMTTFYISGCPKNDGPVVQEMKPLVQALLQALSIVGQLSQALIDNSQEVAQLCGSDAFALASAANIVQGQVCTLATALFDITDFFTCANWNSLYAALVYQAICYDGNDGLTWISACQFVIVFFAMIMLTLRTGFRETGHEGDEQVHRCRACCRRMFCCGSGTEASPVGEMAHDSTDLDLVVVDEDPKAAVTA